MARHIYQSTHWGPDAKTDTGLDITKTTQYAHLDFDEAVRYAQEQAVAHDVHPYARVCVIACFCLPPTYQLLVCYMYHRSHGVWVGGPERTIPHA